MVRGWMLKENLTGKASDALFIEWKYFTIGDGENFCLFSYSVGDPRNLTGCGKGIICASVFQDGRFHSEVIKVPLRSCKLSTGRPDGTFGDSSIKKVPGGIRITGRGKNIRWDVVFKDYKQRFLKDRFNIPSRIYPGSWLDWMMFFNDARGEGTVNIRNVGKMKIRGKGYHDGNAGKWIPFSSRWQVFGYDSHPEDEENISVSLMELYNRKDAVGYLRVSIDHRIYRIEKNNYSLKNISWGRDEKSGVRIPTEIGLKAVADDLRLNIRLHMTGSDSLKIRLSPLLPSLLITEQFGPCELYLKERGRPRIKNHRGMGVNEYTVRKIF